MKSQSKLTHKEIQRQKYIKRMAIAQMAVLPITQISNKDKAALKEIYKSQIAAANAILDTHAAQDIIVNTPFSI